MKFLQWSKDSIRVLACWGLLLLFVLARAGTGFAWEARPHYVGTVTAFEILRSLDAGLADHLMSGLPQGSSAIAGMRYEGLTENALQQAATGTRGSESGITDYAALMRRFGAQAWNWTAVQAFLTDWFRDVEFVDVEGWSGTGRDDPHRDDPWYEAVDDEAHYSEKGYQFTAFNHFMDIKKGPGRFDDFDGYSYSKGSASKDQFQAADDATDDPLVQFLNLFARYKVDEGTNWWFNDEYVHAYGGTDGRSGWYRDCSPAVWRYAFPGDKGIYATVHDELKARFPQAEFTGKEGLGIPYSVFMPVDNLARFWYMEFVRSGDPLALGPVMHAIQDASVPHHAAGYLGNWHGRFESEHGRQIEAWLRDARFRDEVISLVRTWREVAPAPPAPLAQAHWTLRPGINWTVDQMVTWVALNAYREYDQTYNHFRGGYRFDSASARELTKKAIAMSTLALIKAAEGTRVLDSYDFAARAVWARWVNDRATDLPFGGSDTDSRGFALVRPSVTLEDGNAYSNVLETHPRWAPRGAMSGQYHLLVPARARFQAQIGFMQGATATDGATFQLSWSPAARHGAAPPPAVILGSWVARYDRRLESVDLDLGRLSGQRGILSLSVSAGASAGQDWAVWVNPRLIRG